MELLQPGRKLHKLQINKYFGYNSREKLLAKLKLKPGPELSQGVETDDQLWSVLKRL